MPGAAIASRHGTSWVVGVDLGATKVAVGLVSSENQVVATRRFLTEPARGPQRVVERIADCVQELGGLAPPGTAVTSIGVCSPGPLDHETGMVLDPPNLTGWLNVPLRDMVARRVGLPACLEHDAKAAALGEFHYGAGRGAHSMVFIVVGTGVGAAIILDGELYRGQRNSAGEVGHITIDSAGDVCSCGAVGCIETFVSGPALARAYRRILQQAVRDGTITPGPLTNGVTGETVTHLAAEGDPHALRVMERAGEALGTAVASMAMILDIELFVIGSGVAKCQGVLLEPARRAVFRHAFRSVAERVRIVCGERLDDAAILGSAYLARKLKPPAPATEGSAEPTGDLLQRGAVQ